MENNARLIFSSTSEVYGCDEVMPLQETSWGRVNVQGERSCYEEGKRFGESLVYNFNKTHNTRHGVVRIFNTYGPGMSPTDGRVVINFLRQALTQDFLTIYGDGEQTRSFCYIDDLVDALVAYGMSDLTVPINIGNDSEITIHQLAKEVLNIVRAEGKSLDVVHQQSVADEPRLRRPDLGLAFKHLAPWKPKVDIYQGLLATKAWLENELRND